MARTGRPPKPNPIRLLSGNPGKRPIPAEPPPPPGEMPVPARLDGERRAVWTEIVGWLEVRHLASPAYAPFLEVLVDAIAAYRACASRVAEGGAVIRGTRGRGEVSAPAAREMRAFARLVREFGGELGLSPTASARLARGDQRWQDSEARDPERLFTTPPM